MIILLEMLCTVIPTVFFFICENTFVFLCASNCASAFNDPGFCLVGNIISDIKKGARNSQINYMKLEALYQKILEPKRLRASKTHTNSYDAIHETEGKFTSEMSLKIYVASAFTRIIFIFKMPTKSCKLNYSGITFFLLSLLALISLHCDLVDGSFSKCIYVYQFNVSFQILPIRRAALLMHLLSMYGNTIFLIHWKCHTITNTCTPSHCHECD